jgi:hypothetical protein
MIPKLAGIKALKSAAKGKQERILPEDLGRTKIEESPFLTIFVRPKSLGNSSCLSQGALSTSTSEIRPRFAPLQFTARRACTFRKWNPS